MPHYLYTLLFCFFVSCSLPNHTTPPTQDLEETPSTPSPKPALQTTKPISQHAPLQILDKPAPSRGGPPPQQILPTTFIKKNSTGITFSLVSFDDRKHSLAIIDQVNGPGSQYTSSMHLGQSKSALAVINGGFFQPDGSPLGQLSSYGTSRGKPNPSSIGSGYLLWPSSGPPSILRREQYQAADSPNYPHLLQTGPMLAEKGRTISGLSQTKSRVRSFIAWDGQHHWCIGHTSPCSLADLTTAIANKNLAGFRIHTAINLDGGRSSDLWVSKKIAAKEIHIRPFWNKPVRNFILMK